VRPNRGRQCLVFPPPVNCNRALCDHVKMSVLERGGRERTRPSYPNCPECPPPVRELQRLDVQEHCPAMGSQTVWSNWWALSTVKLGLDVRGQGKLPKRPTSLLAASTEPLGPLRFRVFMRRLYSGTLLLFKQPINTP